MPTTLPKMLEYSWVQRRLLRQNQSAILDQTTTKIKKSPIGLCISFSSISSNIQLEVSHFLAVFFCLHFIGKSSCVKYKTLRALRLCVVYSNFWIEIQFAEYYLVNRTFQSLSVFLSGPFIVEPFIVWSAALNCDNWLLHHPGIRWFVWRVSN